MLRLHYANVLLGSWLLCKYIYQLVNMCDKSEMKAIGYRQRHGIIELAIYTNKSYCTLDPAMNLGISLVPPYKIVFLIPSTPSSRLSTILHICRDNCVWASRFALYR